MTTQIFMGVLASTALCTAMFIFRSRRNSLKDVIAAWYVALACLIEWCLCLFLFPLSEIDFMMVMVLLACVVWCIQAIYTTDSYWKLQALPKKKITFYEDPHPN